MEPMKEVQPTITFVTEYKKGEINPKDRQIALRNIKAQRERGMPKELLPLEVGINITINGRHFDHLGATAGVERTYRMKAKDVYELVARALLPYIEAHAALEFTQNDYDLYFGRDKEL